MAQRKLPTKTLLVALGVPAVFVPGLILASVLGWDWKEGLKRIEMNGGFDKSEEVFPKKVRVINVLDGDTFETDKSMTIRMIGIDAPNRGEEGYIEAKEYLNDLIGGEEVGLEYDNYQEDKYGRILAYVWEECSSQIGCINKTRMINWVMIKKGFAKSVSYEDRAPLKYQDLLLNKN